MKINLIFMKSRVANRIFYLFIICALLPIGLLAFISLDQLAEDQNKESFQKLHQVSKNIGMSILEGLSLIRAEMQIVALAGNAKLQTPSFEVLNNQGRDTPQRLLGLTLFEDHKAIKTYLGKPCSYPNIADSDLGYLLSNGGALHVERLNENSYGIFLIVGLNEVGHRRALLVGEINPEYLWAIARASLPPMTEAYILGPTGKSLFSTSPLSEATMAGIEKKIRQTSLDRLEWYDNDGTHFASHWSIFLRTSLISDDWKVIVTQSKNEALAAVNRVSKFITLILIVTFLVVLFLSSVQIRRNLELLARLKDGTERVSRGDFESRINVRSGDEFEELAISFNTMSEQIGRHFVTLNEMTRMITAIFTSLDKKRIIETVLFNINNVVLCDAVCLTVMEAEANKGLTFFKSNVQDRECRHSQKKCNVSSTRIKDNRKNYRKFND
jgi:HAMP domain-containing protein